MSTKPTPTDEEFLYIGLTPRQVFMLRGHPNEMRQLVYDHAIRMLMETGPGYDGEISTVNL